MILYQMDLNMDIEDIAKIDLFLRSQNGTQNLLDVDALIITDNEPNSVTKFKSAAKRLTTLNNESLEEIKGTWHNLFSQQVRFSVSRAKEKIKGN